MSAAEQERGQEQKSSVAISENSKGEPAVTVKVYEGCDGDELDLIRELAVGAYRLTREAVRS